jgi:hypothetical protein
MDLRSLLLKQLNTAERIVTDGHEVIPAWRIATPSADWVILSRFDHAEPNRQDWVLHQMRRFNVGTTRNVRNQSAGASNANLLILLVGAGRFEIPTPCSQSKCSPSAMPRALAICMLQILRDGLSGCAMGFVTCLWDGSVKLMGSKCTTVAGFCRVGRLPFCDE